MRELRQRVADMLCCGSVASGGSAEAASYAAEAGGPFAGARAGGPSTHPAGHPRNHALPLLCAPQCQFQRKSLSLSDHLSRCWEESR